MKDQDKQKFLEIMNGCAAVYRTTITDTQLKIYWEALRDIDINEISSAFSKHIRSAKFFPVPAEIIERTPSAVISKHIGADEAWGIVLESFDEASTVVLTQEIMEARALVREIYDSGDAIGARMAFRDTYNRIIAAADEPRWFVSAGHDGARRADAIAKAVELGRLPKYCGQQYMLGHDGATATVAGLIESASQQEVDSELKARVLRGIDALRAMLNTSDDGGIDRREKDRKKFELHRQNELARLAEKQKALH